MCDLNTKVCKDLVSDSDSAGMISAVILSTVATVPGLQQYASERLRTQHHGKRSNTQSVSSMDN